MNDNTDSLLSRYHWILRKYNISQDGENFYQEGYDCLSKEEGEKYVRTKIKPIFSNIRYELDVQVTEIKKKMIPLDSDIKECKDALNTTDPSGFLSRIEEKIDIVEKMEEEAETTAFPEKKAQRSLKDVFTQFEENFKKLIKESSNDLEVLATFLKQKQLFNFTLQHFSAQKRLDDALQSKVHSNFFPKASFYITGYCFCILLLMAEVGFSMSIIQLIMEGWGRSGDMALSFLYAVAISLTTAACFKKLMDAFLYRSWLKTVLFWLVVITLFSILLILFSYGRSAGILEYKITNKAVILSFFSIFFALGNAWIFRESSYMHQTHSKLNKLGGDSKSFHKEKEEHISKWNNRLQELNNKKNRLLAEQKIMESDTLVQIRNMLINLQEMSIATFWRGYDKKVADEQSNGPEANVA